MLTGFFNNTTATGHHRGIALLGCAALFIAAGCAPDTPEPEPEAVVKAPAPEPESYKLTTGRVELAAPETLDLEPVEVVLVESIDPLLQRWLDRQHELLVADLDLIERVPEAADGPLYPADYLRLEERIRDALPAVASDNAATDGDAASTDSSRLVNRVINRRYSEAFNAITPANLEEQTAELAAMLDEDTEQLLQRTYVTEGDALVRVNHDLNWLLGMQDNLVTLGGLAVAKREAELRKQQDNPPRYSWAGYTREIGDSLRQAVEQAAVNRGPIDATGQFEIEGAGLPVLSAEINGLPAYFPADGDDPAVRFEAVKTETRVRDGGADAFQVSAGSTSASAVPPSTTAPGASE